MSRLRSVALGLAIAAAALVADAQGIAPQSNGPMDISADNGTFVNAACEFDLERLGRGAAGHDAAARQR